MISPQETESEERASRTAAAPHTHGTGHCVFTPGQGAHKNFMLFNGAVTPTAAAQRATVGGVPVAVRSISLLSRWAQFEVRSVSLPRAFPAHAPPTRSPCFP